MPHASTTIRTRADYHVTSTLFIPLWIPRNNLVRAAPRSTEHVDRINLIFAHVV
jgi:hypothetical protein